VRETFQVRAFEERDVAAALALWAGTEGLGHGPGDSAAAITRFLGRNPGISSVALEHDVLVGVALCGHDGRRGSLYQLAYLKVGGRFSRISPFGFACRRRSA
jgi:hypothetical protein